MLCHQYSKVKLPKVTNLFLACLQGWASHKHPLWTAEHRLWRHDTVRTADMSDIADLEFQPNAKGNRNKTRVASQRHYSIFHSVNFETHGETQPFLHPNFIRKHQVQKSYFMLLLDWVNFFFTWILKTIQSTPPMLPLKDETTLNTKGSSLL